MKKERKSKDVSLNRVAELAKVSATTVSFVFNSPARVAASTRQKVLRIAGELGYFQPKKGRRREAIGLLLSDYRLLTADSYYRLVALGVMEALKADGLRLHLDSIGPDQDYFPQWLINGEVDGVICLGDLRPDLGQFIRRKGLPLLLIGSCREALGQPRLELDGKHGAFQAVNHLVALGHKKIAVLTDSLIDQPSAVEKIAGYRLALAKAGIKERRDFFVQVEEGAEASLSAAKLLFLTDPPTAIFCTSDRLAVAACRSARGKGLNVPHETSIVGFSDFVPEDVYDLTSVQIEPAEAGKKAVATLRELAADPTKEAVFSVPSGVVVRKTTAPPPRFLAQNLNLTW